MQIDTEIKKILIKNGWNEFNYNLMKDSYINKIKKNYTKAGYILEEDQLNKLSLFCNLKIKYITKKGLTNTLFFYVDKIKSFSRLFLQNQALKLHVDNVNYIADIDPGYFCVWMDNNEGIWVDFEREVYFYGNDIFEGIINIVNDNPLKFELIDTMKH